ncbi:MAG: FG-GAP-like repeat-containing protein [Acidobacteriota bacterium]|nr:FG-GAP-like repeat-containing protein [Acidobacteriota bacterium]
MREIKKQTHGQIWKAALVFLAVFAWAAIPFLTQNAVEASGEATVSTLRATLTAPNGAINPHGTADFSVDAGGNRELEVEVEDVNAANGTTFTVFVNNISVGQLSISLQRGKLKLRTESGQSVPNINAGSTVEVKNGTTTIVSGVFGSGNTTPSPSGSPTPSPTGSPNATPTGSPTATPRITPSVTPTVTPQPNAGHLFAPLSGATINGVLPSGFGKFEQKATKQELEVYVRQVNLPIGTVLSVFVDNVSVGQMTVRSGGEAELELENEHGQAVPNVVAGSTLQIKNGGNVILSGVFAGDNTNPAPTPSGRGRFFEGHLNGASLTPPVSTSGRGEIKVTLNSNETQATISGEFEHLSSAQTTAKIQVTIGAATTVVFDLGTIGGREGHFAPQTFAVTAEQVQQLRTGLWFAVIGSVNFPNGEVAGRISSRSHDSDFDGDGRNDLAVFRPSNGTWYSQNSAGVTQQILGGANDKSVSGDYDGDGKTDAAVYRDINGAGIWEIRRSSDGGTTRQQFGLASDKTVRGDFDGDGRTDLAVFRPSNGTWYIQKSDNTGYTFVQFGIAEDKPIAVDMDGDGKDDIAVFRPSTGVWYWLRSSDNGFSAIQFGTRGDVPLVGDFDGDGKSDVSVYRPSNGVWYIRHSSDGAVEYKQFGLSDDIPVAGNYDDDDKTDIAVFRPSTGTWYIWRSSDGTVDYKQFGASGDIPTPAR